MGYFDNLAASSFKSDSDGKTVFFPWGIVGRGYILKNPEQEKELKRFIKIYHIISLVLVLFIGPFLQLWLLCFSIVPVAIIIWLLKTKTIISDLPVSNEKLKYGESLRKIVNKKRS